MSHAETTEEIPREVTLKKFLGGIGLATKSLFNEVHNGIDPLGSANKLIVMTEPLIGNHLRVPGDTAKLLNLFSLVFRDQPL